MPDTRRELTATRSVFLELKDEHTLVQEGYEFLDEKRILLAREILNALDAFRAMQRRWDTLHQAAVESLRAAIARHGFDGLTVFPARSPAGDELTTKHRKILSIPIVEAGLSTGVTELEFPPVMPSTEAAECAQRYHDLLSHSARQAAMAGNLRRLCQDYRRTERRARALENVLLPEIDASMRLVEEQLEAIDQEEALRVRHARSDHSLGPA